MKTAEQIYEENGCNSKRDIIEAMKEYANSKLNEAASLSQEMIYENKVHVDTNINGLKLRNFQNCYATSKQSILSLKDSI